MRIGILGAGMVGAALARLAADCGHSVMLGSRHPEALAALAAGIGGTAGSLEDAASFGEACVLAVPFSARAALPAAALAGRVVLDAMNHYPERDGPVPALDRHEATTSGMVAACLPGARLVKAFNAILARDLPADARPPVLGGRRALPIAGEDAGAKRVAAELHQAFGFEALDAGPLAESWRFERAKPAYCIPLDRAGLQRALDAATREGELPHGSWRR